MRKFDENGFISGRIQYWIDNHRTRHEAIFSTALDLNRECHKFLSGRSVDLGSELQLTTSVLFARMLEIYQAILIVIGRGMTSAGRVLFRTYLESYFQFAAIHKDPNFLAKYLNQIHVQRKALVNRLRNSKSPGLEQIREPLTDDLIAEIKQTIEQEKISRLSTEETARRAGLHDIYLIAYPILSGAVHTSALDLESHLDYDEQENAINGFKYGPSDEETKRIVGLASMTMAETLGTISQTFGEDRTEMCAKMKDSFYLMLSVPNT
jgi:hypothetical protein